MKKTVLPLLLAMGALTSYGQYTEFENGGMETWRPITAGADDLETPDQWCGTDSLIAAIAPTANALPGVEIEVKQQVFEDSNAHGGEAAAKLVTEDLGSTLGIVPGALVNAQLDFDLMGFAAVLDPAQLMDFMTFDGGTLVSAQVDTVSAWVNADAANTEAASVTVMAVITVQGSEGDSMVVVGQGFLAIEPTDGYEEIFVPVTYEDSNAVPERLLVFFASSDQDAATTTVGNTLLVDDVSYSVAGSSSIFRVTRDAKLVKVYPVPATDQVHFELKGGFDQATLNVFDVQGRLIRSENVNAGTTPSIQVSNWAKGTYYFNLKNAQSGLLDRGSFVLN